MFDLKRDACGNIVRHKARLVAKGFSQVHGVDYQEVFSPVTKFETIRLLMGITASRDLEIHHIDIKTAFLCSDLDAEIYLTPPWLPPKLRALFNSESWNKKVWKLLKALYGLKQGSRAWNKTLRKLLQALGFKESRVDPSFYVRAGGSDTTYVLVYVDDLLVAAERISTLEKFKSELGEEFEIRDLGEVTLFLGIQIKRDRKSRTITLFQKNYTRVVLERFRMEPSKPNHVPLQKSLVTEIEHLTNYTDGPYTSCHEAPYRELMGSVMFLATTTRPDIMFAVSFLAKYMSSYSEVHWRAVKSLLRYLKGTQDMGLRFNADNTILGYTDSDWAGDTLTRKSRSGYVFQIGNVSLSWKSKQQSVVAASSVEAEYIAQAQAVREALWIRGMCQEFGLMDDKVPVTLYADNTGAIALANDIIVSNRSKHIDVVYHLTRDYVEKGMIALRYIPSELIVADGLTKALGSVKHNAFVEMLGMKTY